MRGDPIKEAKSKIKCFQFKNGILKSNVIREVILLQELTVQIKKNIFHL